MLTGSCLADLRQSQVGKPILRSYLAHFLIVVVLKIQVIGGGHLIASVIIVIRI